MQKLSGNDEGIQYICKLIYEAYRVPVLWLDNAAVPRLALGLSAMDRPSVQGTGGLPAEVVALAGGSRSGAHKTGAGDPVLPRLHTTGFLENFIILQLPGAGGAIVTGPVLNAPVTGENAESLLRDHSIPPRQQASWLEYYSSLPVISLMRWYHAALLLHTLATGQALSVTELLLDAGTLAEPPPPADASPDLDLSYRREHTWLHHDPMQEREMFRHITDGDKAGLLRTHASFAEESYGRLSRKSQLRSKKNLAVSSITLATRAAIEGGLFWEIAYTLSDFHIQHIEELRDIPAVDRAMLAALCDFADQVADSRSARPSRISDRCRNYIFNHLYEELPLSRLAEYTGLNASYLSQLFKKETGTAISDYIQQQRIEEAKRLMELPGIMLSDIATRLHFNDQSYFTKVFKKYTGLTPRQYKQQR
ncbi:helix-turn-helix domain-containing protein [Paenibacillus piscarius]|uniref:helix-turn-helix domain-containing protein n=1 Tax=Paenibacillus piscarius TaxID=1089681 RepID=UPI001EE7EA07|nr:helix-turn-helix domain-containing protein [Paenibacillus piscarius]